MSGEILPSPGVCVMISPAWHRSSGAERAVHNRYVGGSNPPGATSVVRGSDPLQHMGAGQGPPLLGSFLSVPPLVGICRVPPRVRCAVFPTHSPLRVILAMQVRHVHIDGCDGTCTIWRPSRLAAYHSYPRLLDRAERASTLGTGTASPVARGRPKAAAEFAGSASPAGGTALPFGEDSDVASGD